MSIDRGNEDKYKSTIHGKVVENQFVVKKSKREIAGDYLTNLKLEEIKSYGQFLRALHNGIKAIFPAFNFWALAILGFIFTINLVDQASKGPFDIFMALVGLVFSAGFNFCLITYILWAIFQQGVKGNLRGKDGEKVDLGKVLKDMLENARIEVTTKSKIK